MNPNRQEAGRAGGLATAMRHDMRAIGRLGGRPRLQPISELRQQSASKAKEKEEVLHASPSTLANLRRLWLQKRSGGSLDRLPPEGGVLGTPDRPRVQKHNPTT